MTSPTEHYDVPEWREILDRLARMREDGDFPTGNVEFVKEQLQSPDDRVRAAAALTAEACLFEPQVLDLVLELAEFDDVPAIRKAAVQSLGHVIHEGVQQDFEDGEGPSTAMDDVEEWEEFQSNSLQEDYQRVKSVLFNFLEYDEDPEIQALALAGLADLGYQEAVREKVGEFLTNASEPSRLAALKVVGKYPQFWEGELLKLLDAETPVPVLLEAVSACFSSDSDSIAARLVDLLNHDDPEVLQFTILTLANLNRTHDLEAILQNFSLHPDKRVQEAAREGINQVGTRNFELYMRDDLGMEGFDEDI